MSGGDGKTILFINHWAANMGGAEHSLLDILRGLAGRCDCHLVASEGGRLTEGAKGAGVVCHVVPCKIRPRRFARDMLLSTIIFSLPEIMSFLLYVLRVRGLATRLRPSCIHANVPKSHLALFCIMFLGYRGAGIFHMREIFSARSVPWALYRFLFPGKGASVIAISRSVQNGLPPRMRAASSVIYNGVLVRSHPRPSAGAHTGMRYLYCGRIVPWKGCHFLLEIFEALRSRCGEAAACDTLTLVGDTSYWPQQYRLSLAEGIHKRGLAANCFLLPNTDDVQALYSGHDVFVNASFQEPFGRSIAEAQGAGLAVVSFDSGGVSEIVEHGITGSLVPYGDTNAFVQSLIHLRTNRSLAATMGEAGRKRAELLFNRDIQVPRIGDEIIRRARRARSSS